MRYRVRPLLRLALMAVSLLFVLASAGCEGGDDDGRTASIIHRLLQAAATGDSGALESFAGRLPDDLPAAPPLYPDADLIVSSRQPAPFADAEAETGSDQPGAGAPQPVLYFIVLDTTDERGQVFAFYEQALDEAPWQLEASFSTEQLDTLQFANADDADVTGVVSIATGGEDGRTSILISLQDAGAFREEEPPFELGSSLPVPKKFPADVPVYRGATITGTAFFREPGNEGFLLIFLTTDSQEEVVEFYRGEFEQRGWTVMEGAVFGLEERVDFRDEGRDIQGEVFADRFSQDRRYTEVHVQVQVNPERDRVEPAEEEATPDPTAEPSDEAA